MKVKLLYDENTMEIKGYSNNLNVVLSAEGCVEIEIDVPEDFISFFEKKFNYSLSKEGDDIVLVKV